MSADNVGNQQGGNIAFNSGALANGTTAGTVKTTAAIAYTIDGAFLSKAITDNISVAFAGPSVFGQSADGSFTGAVGGSTRLYGLFLDAAGAITVSPGPIVSTAALVTKQAPLQFPGIQKGRACFGALRVAVTANTTFVPGTTALNAAGVTSSYLNLSSVPGEPLKA